MGLKDFIKESESNKYDDVSFDFLKIGLNESKSVIILNSISEGDDVMLYYNQMYDFNAPLVNSEGKKYRLQLPVLDESKHDSEKSNNEFFNVAQVMGLQNKLKPNFLLWVADADSEDETNPDVYLWSPSKTVVDSLIAHEEKYGDLRGRFVTISKGKTKQSSQTVIPMYTGRKGFTEPAFDVDSITVPCSLEETVYYQTIDSQVRFFNNVKESFMQWMEDSGTPIEEWMFTIDDEKGNGTLKPQFMKVEAGEFEL